MATKKAPAKKTVAKKTTTKKTVVKKAPAKKSINKDGSMFNTMYNTNVSILLAMAVEALILLLGYLIIINA